ncbi:MAG: chemotaxis protein CheW [Nitrospinota bacterium]|nr:chemotaxis protein CheW [Nitrospinota bacterium]
MADDSLMNEFFMDTQGHLDNIEEDTLRLEKTPDDTEIIGDVFRRVHSIKGNAGIMGLVEIYSYGQGFEAFLEGIRDRKFATAAEVEKIFKYLDGLKAMMMNLRGEEVETSHTDLEFLAPEMVEDQKQEMPYGAARSPSQEKTEPEAVPSQAQPVAGELRQAQSRIARQKGLTESGPITVLTFQIGPEIYGIDIMKVKEIITYELVTRVPNTKPFVDGVMNLRDQVIPVFDLCRKLGVKIQNFQESAEAAVGSSGREKSIIVVEISKVATGLAVDYVTGIRVFEQSDITPPTSFTGKISSDFLMGVGQMEHGAVIILNAPDICDPVELLY